MTQFAAFGMCAVTALAINWAAFVPAWLARTERFYDATGTVTYLAVLILAATTAVQLGPRGLLLAVLVGIWALRLGLFLLRRVRAEGRDRRFDNIKTDWLKFLGSWTIQALWVICTAAAALAAMQSTAHKQLDRFALVGTFIWVVGFTVEAVADAQKRRFRSDPNNQDRFISSGLWSRSQHPNYFGEITLWVGIAVVAAPSVVGWWRLTLLSPVFVFLLITTISGIPLLDAAAQRRWGSNPSFRAYVERTPTLVPRLWARKA